MYWTASLPNGQKNCFYNPIKQNRTHLKWLGQYVGADIPLFSIIVFSERCELKKVTVESPDIKVIKRDLVYATVRNIWNGARDALSDDQVQALFDKLNTLTNADEAVKLAHIESIEKMKERRQLEPQAAQPQAEHPKVCPRCGKTLVLRTAKKGENAGSQFYGCSGYPSCRYTERL